MQIRFGAVNLKSLAGELAAKKPGDAPIVLRDTTNGRVISATLIRHEDVLSKALKGPRYVVEGTPLNPETSQHPAVAAFWEGVTGPIINIAKYVVPTDTEGNTDWFDRVNPN